MSASNPSVDPLLGTLVAGRYLVRRRMGQGGQGVVYAAEDRLLRRRVALKFPRPDKAHDPATAQRLIREGRAAARIHHPRVVTLHDLLFLPDGRPCAVLELIEGGTLADLLRGGRRLAPTAATRLAAEVCRALLAIHDRSLIHLDIKPGNVFLSRGGAVKLGDFSLATTVTAAGIAEAETVNGTLPYMAPEQLAGDLLWAATDLYSLGVVYFEMLTGRTPFTGAELLAHARAPYSTVVPHPCDLDPALPRVCGELAARTLARRSWERSPDAAALLADLKQILTQLAPPAS